MTAVERKMLGFLKEVLDAPWAYLAFQKAYGADRLRKRSVEILAPKAGERILDVGCGPAYLLDYLPDVEYVGFDIQAQYLAYARRRFGARGTFVLGHYDEQQRRQHGPFDAILLMGVMHHLNDAVAVELLGLLANSLKSGGRVVTLDPCFAADQSRIARFMASNDRGQHVRDASAYEKLARGVFAEVWPAVIHGACRVPSTEIIMKLTQPKPS
jgi:SAM-dependent methyltransferase